MVEIAHFSKSYGQNAAVRNVTFCAHPGAVTALLGRNGAGKSTVLKGVAGFHLPSLGTVRVCGADALEDGAALRLLAGYAPEEGAFYGDFTALEHLCSLGAIRFAALAALDGTPPPRPGALRSHALWMAERCGIDRPSLDKKTRSLSRGYRQRLSLASALLLDPPVLVLDEPTAGLDPVQMRQTRALIADLAVDKTVLLSTHQVPDVEALCTSVCVLRDGEVSFFGTTEEAMRQSGEATLEAALVAFL
jgi:ABC-2 type transport system ATP-binding protein